VDGVSLTVNEVTAASCAVNLIPHTIAHTNLPRLAPGVAVNIEIDVIARYIERMNAPGG
jgi:riboflavin synthase